MKRRTWIIFVVLFAVILLCACSKQTGEPELGRYATSDGFSFVILEENDRFLFSRSVWSSYLPLGTYRTEGDRLILHVTDEEEYLFSIEQGELIFLENTMGDALVEPGTVFSYDPDWKD